MERYTLLYQRYSGAVRLVGLRSAGPADGGTRGAGLRGQGRRVSEAFPGMPEAPPPAMPRDAAVAVSFRPGKDDPEVFWLGRGATLAFAAGFYAFPGGRVDAADAACRWRVRRVRPRRFAWRRRGSSS